MSTQRNSPRKLNQAERRAAVAALYAQGLTQLAIGKRLGIAQGTVSKDLAIILNELSAAARSDVQTRIGVEVEKLNAVEREAWQAWNRSKLYADGKPVDEFDLDDHKPVAEPGDPRYLTLVVSTSERRSKLLGLDAPEQHRWLVQSGFSDEVARALVDALNAEGVTTEQRNGILQRMSELLAGS